MVMMMMMPVRGRAFGARRLVEWRMRRACSLFEAWGAWPRSRFAARSANCLKKRPTRFELAERKKTASFGKSLVLNGCGKFISQSGRSLFTKQMMTE